MIIGHDRLKHFYRTSRGISRVLGILHLLNEQSQYNPYGHVIVPCFGLFADLPVFVFSMCAHTWIVKIIERQLPEYYPYSADHITSPSG